MLYLFRLRATARPAISNPVNASVPRARWVSLSPDDSLQPRGSKLQRGLSASKEVDIINRNKAIKLSFSDVVSERIIAAFYCIYLRASIDRKKMRRDRCWRD